MQPDRIQIEARARGPSEAIDLGFRMARTWWRPLYCTWLVLVVPSMALVVALAWSQPVFGVIAIWWLKPLFERAPLHVLSEVLFGHVPRLQDTLRAAPRWLRGGTLQSLTLLRLSPSRAVMLPILQLEGLRGRPFALRALLVVAPQTPSALGLLWACVVFQLFPIVAGGVALAVVFFPKGFGLLDAFEFLQSLGTTNQLRLLAIGYATSLTLVEPLYVAAGFALYINRRIFLEGWDIDLVFRKLARRAAAPAQARAALRGSVVALLAALLLPAARAPAADDAVGCRAERPTDARVCVEEVLADPEFGGERTVNRWVLRRSDRPDAERWDPLSDWELESEETEETGGSDDAGDRITTWLSGLGALVRNGGIALLVMGAVLLAAHAVRVYWRRREDDAAADAPSQDAPRTSPHLRPGELPSDVLAAARERFTAGDAAAALSLLYRSALACLDQRGVPLPASATEYECLRQVRAGAPESLAEDFDRVVRAWALCAYGSRPPDPLTFWQLCDRWSVHLTDATH